MKASKKTQYALRAVIVLANLKEGVCSVNSIAEKEGISSDYLEKILSLLERKGILTVKRGAGGGYCLKKKPEEITLKDIFLATGERTAVVDCLTERCVRDKSCGAAVAWRKVDKKIEEAVSSIKLSDLI